MAMLTFVLKRLAALVFTVIAGSFVVFGSLYVSPGSPESVLFGSRQPSAELRAAVRHSLGLDQPFWVRYFRWLGNAFSGDLGISLVSQQAVAERIAQPLLITVTLVAYAALLIAVAGVGQGLLAALRPGWVDGLITVETSLVVAVPSFVAATVAISVFAVGLGWFPAFGLEPGITGWLHSLTLPAAALALVSSGLVARVTRSTAREQLASEHVLTARARGLPGGVTVRRHVLRNSSGPVMTVIGLQVASLFAGAVVVENAFGLGGAGQLLISSVNQKDFPTVQALALVLVVAFVVINTVADLLHGVIDPRVHLQGAAT